MPEGASVSAKVIAERISEHLFAVLFYVFNRQSYIRGPAGEWGSEAASRAVGPAEWAGQGSIKGGYCTSQRRVVQVGVGMFGHINWNLIQWNQWIYPHLSGCRSALQRSCPLWKQNTSGCWTSYVSPMLWNTRPQRLLNWSISSTPRRYWLTKPTNPMTTWSAKYDPIALTFTCR